MDVDDVGDEIGHDPARAVAHSRLEVAAGSGREAFAVGGDAVGGGEHRFTVGPDTDGAMVPAGATD